MPNVPYVSYEQPLALTIAGMIGAHCVSTIRAVLDAQAGVSVRCVTVGAATITFDPQLGSPATLIDAIRAVGYSPSFAASDRVHVVEGCRSEALHWQ